MTVSVFDAYGTLLDVQSAVLRHADVIGPNAVRLADLWRTKQLEYTWVLNGIGRYEPFESLTEQALHYAADIVGGLSVEMRGRLLETYTELDPFVEVGTALARLRSAGHTVVVFSNASTTMLRRALVAASLDHLIDDLVSVEAAGCFKPDPRTYALLDPWRFKELTFYSSNRWDIAGASAAGIDAVWINRRQAPDEYRTSPPRATSANLLDATDRQVS